MRTRIKGITVALACAGALALVPSCRGATSIELVLDTDVPCLAAKEITTSIRAGNLDDYQSRPPTAVTTRCDETTGRIGSLVLVPREEDDDEVAVLVVTGKHNVSPERCLTQPSTECIVARRIVRFVPHENVVLPIRMRDVCSGIACGADETCLDGACVPAARKWDFVCTFCEGDAAPIPTSTPTPTPTATPTATPTPTATENPPPPPPPKEPKDAGATDGGKKKKGKGE